MDTSVSDDNWSTGHRRIFYFGYFYYRCAKYNGMMNMRSRKRTVMDTSHLDIIKERETVTTL